MAAKVVVKGGAFSSLAENERENSSSLSNERRCLLLFVEVLGEGGLGGADFEGPSGGVHSFSFSGWLGSRC